MLRQDDVQIQQLRKKLDTNRDLNRFLAPSWSRIPLLSGLHFLVTTIISTCSITVNTEVIELTAQSVEDSVLGLRRAERTWFKTGACPLH